MFVDLVGSTELSADLDPEDFRYVIAAYHDCVGDVVAQHGGFVARYHGDGELIYFGYPRARENDAETAIRAGLQILDAVNRLDTSAGPAGTLRARIGIATGLTVVGDLALSRSLLAAEVVGDAANLAARLQTLAEPGTMIADDTTRRLAGGLFEYRQLDPVKLKGIRAPHRPWAVVGESELESRFEALRAPHTPFVNREDEIDLLSRRWEQAKSGEGRAVLICGDAGMGKSRLVTALEHMLRDEPHEPLSNAVVYDWLDEVFA